MSDAMEGKPGAGDWLTEGSVGRLSLPTAETEQSLHNVPTADNMASPSTSEEMKVQMPDPPSVVDSHSGGEDPMFAHLDPHEREILKRQVEVKEVTVGFFGLYRYATNADVVLLVISTICSVAAGAIFPLMTIAFGKLAGTFTDYELGQLSRSEFRHNLSHYTLYFVYFAIGEFISIYICTVGFIYVGQHVTQKMRERYLKAIFQQNMAFFDQLGNGEVITRITADTNLVQVAVSEKVSLTLTSISTFLTSFVIAFIYFWKLALVSLSTVVAILLLIGVMSRFIVKHSKRALQSYSLGSTVAEEVLSSIRNTVAFGTQDKLAKQYDEYLTESEKWGAKGKFVLAFSIGGMICIIMLNIGLDFWMGSRFLVKGEVTLSDILTIVFAVVIGAFSLGNVAPHAQAFTSGVAAAAKIFGTIDRVSPLDPSSTEGEKLEHVEGIIDFQQVKHIYPSRPEVVAMEDFTLHVPAGKTTALVGASGSGKSTVVGLLQRFYEPVGGSILVDGHPIESLNLRWLRQQIAVVSQEPVLFATTIYDNIKHGLIGSDQEGASEEKQRELVYDAARMANAHDFVSALPEGYETNVGERGFLLSGGQKQRIAIARAIVSDPKILLLDEATSALDTKSEKVVHSALEVASQGRTTIVIAHRLSTIKAAENIVVMARGRIIEQGSHEDLIAKNGSYYSLVEAQQIREGPEQGAVADDSTLAGCQEEVAAEPNAEALQTLTEKSVPDHSLAERILDPDPRYSLWKLITLVAGLNKPEIGWMLLGLAFSIIAGGGTPTHVIFFSKSIASLAEPPRLFGKLRSDINFWASMYLMLAFVLLLTYSIHGYSFAKCSERLLHRARERSFRAILRQDVSFFDKEENSTGALVSFLSTQTTHLAGISGSVLGTLLTVSTTLVAAVTISITFGWKLGLVCTATVPVLLGCGFLRFYMLARFQAKSNMAYEHSASYACEATSAIRTVASLTREEEVWLEYHRQLDIQGRKSLISALRASILYACSQSLYLLCAALGFWYGGTLIENHEYTIFQFFVCFTEIMFGTQSAGTIFSFAPDMGKAKDAAFNLKKLFDYRPLIDTWSTEGQSIESVEGAIEFRDVTFRYPTRPEQSVLKKVSFSVKPGQYVALVGASGCGKSTTVALLERFYDATSGGVFVDGKDVSTLNVNEYRSYLALVSQEPTLYQGSIRENILLGGNQPDADEAALVQACKDANIYDFIMSLPDGFSTPVGSKGSLLSGGQKQRVAIARALYRDPRILLLDEATSALDSESEKIVQAALDTAARGRTTVAVAHRLSTIQQADQIFVFERGGIVERGSHRELLGLGGRYAELVRMQSLGKA